MRDPDLFINVPSQCEIWVLGPTEFQPEGTQIAYTHPHLGYLIRIAWRLKVNEEHTRRSTQSENEDSIPGQSGEC